MISLRAPPKRLENCFPALTAATAKIFRNRTSALVLETSIVAEIVFHDPEQGRVSPALKMALPALLAESPDPDSALFLFDRLASESPQDVLELLNQNHQLAHYAIVVFGHSRFLGETLIQNPDVLQTLLRPRCFDQNFSREELGQALARFRARTFEKDVAVVLARFKRREYIRILLRDVLRVASLGETTADISALSDVLLEEALREAKRFLLTRYGVPQHLDANGRAAETPFAILSLGKLGGDELNYSSDIDLLYLFGDGPELPGGDNSNREYFIRLAQHLTELLSRVTSEGPVFRIDLRLRPQGSEGELAISLGQALHYYASVAHDWERQALIKVRYSAGDAALAWQFIQGVQPYVYSQGSAESSPEIVSATERTPATRRLNFAAIKTALVAREKMQKRYHEAHVGDKGPAGVDVKLEAGGIRDIEFLVQCLQRVYGAREPWLRSGGTLASLHKLHDKRHISSREFQELTAAYEFLRHLEHRLQLREGRQTHHVPASGQEMQIVARTMDAYCLPEHRRQGLDFITQVRQRMAEVEEIYQRVVYQQTDWERPEAETRDFRLHGPPEPEMAERSSQHVLERVGRDAPELYAIATRPGLAPLARKNLLRFLSAAFTSSERYAAVLRHVSTVAQGLPLFEMSDYLSDILARYPEEIATLAEFAELPVRMASGYLFDDPMTGERAAADPVFAYLAGSPATHGEKMAHLRQHFRHRVFAAGAKDILKPRGIYQSFSEMTAAAEDAIGAAWEIAGAPKGLAVLLLGRLGSREFDVLSDADVVFICEENQNLEVFGRAASQMVQVLSAYTQEGMLFPTDTRLRPRGREGELLISPSQLERYFEREAQAWEALSYTKLRFVAGARHLAERALAASKSLFERFAADAEFGNAVRAMRAKLEETDAPEKNFKTLPGAIYDIDFLCGFLLVKHPAMRTGGTLRDRLWRCADAGLLQNFEAAILDARRRTSADPWIT